MKIILVIPTMQQGGAERVMSELASLWAEQGHDVHLVLLAHSEDFYEIHESTTVHRLGFRNLGVLRKLKAEVETLVKLRAIVTRLQPDFVLSFMEKFNEFTLLATSGLNVPVYVSDRSNPRKPRSFMMRCLKKMTYARAAGVVAQTQFAKECLSEMLPMAPVKVIRNPIRDVQLFPSEERGKTIIAVGRLVEEKGFSYLLRAFKQLADPSWRLLILGGGPLRNELEALAVSLGISDQVEMPGAVSQVDIHLARSSVFAFPSQSEGFPNALVEAMIAGLPCVSFDCDAGPRDVIIHGQNGFLVEQGDLESFVTCLKQLCESEALRAEIGSESQRLRSHYSAEVVANEWLDYLGGQKS